MPDNPDKDKPDKELKDGPQVGTSKPTDQQGAIEVNANIKTKMSKGRSMPNLMAIMPRPKPRTVSEASLMNKVPTHCIKLNRTDNTSTIIPTELNNPVEIPLLDNVSSVTNTVKLKPPTKTVSPRKIKRDKKIPHSHAQRRRDRKKKSAKMTTTLHTSSSFLQLPSVVKLNHEQQTDDSYLKNNEDYEMLEMWKAIGMTKNKFKDIIEGLKTTKVMTDKATSTQTDERQEALKIQNILSDVKQLKSTLDIEKELELIFKDDNDGPINLKTTCNTKNDKVEQPSCSIQTTTDISPTLNKDTNAVPENQSEAVKDEERLKRAMLFSDYNKHLLMKTYANIKQNKPNDESPKNMSKRTNAIPKNMDKTTTGYSPYHLDYFSKRSINKNNKNNDDNNITTNNTSVNNTQMSNIATSKKVTVITGKAATESSTNANALAIQANQQSGSKTNSNTNNASGQSVSVTPILNMPVATQTSPGNVNKGKPTANVDANPRLAVNISANTSNAGKDVSGNYMNMRANMDMPSGSGMANVASERSRPVTTSSNTNTNYIEYHQRYQMNLSANSIYSLNQRNGQTSHASYQERYEELTSHANVVNVGQNIQMPPYLPAANVVANQVNDRRNHVMTAQPRQTLRAGDMNRLMHQMNYARQPQNEAAPTPNFNQMGSWANVVPDWPWDTHVMPSARRWN